MALASYPAFAEITVSENDPFKLSLAGRFQGRFDFIRPSDEIGLDQGDTVNFQIRRARLEIGIQQTELRWSLMLQIGADSNDALIERRIVSPGEKKGGEPEIFDAWFEHRLSEHLGIKLGQFKVPFSRQNLTHSGLLQFPERAYSTESATQIERFHARDIGIEVFGRLAKEKVQYAFAIVNGDGPNSRSLDNNPTLYGRIILNPNGKYCEAEGDLMVSQTLASTLGVGIHHEQNTPNSTIDSLTRVVVDAGLKYSGLSLQGEYMLSRMVFGPPANENNVSNDHSLYVQGGYFVCQKRLELVGRTSHVLWSGGDGMNDRSEYSLGANLYFSNHRFKCQISYSRYNFGRIYLHDRQYHRLIVQTQLWF